MLAVADRVAGMIKAEHVRAGRALLDWTQRELARRAQLGLSTVRDYEAGRRIPLPENLEAMRRTMEAAGLQFLDDGQRAPAGGLGVRFKSPTAR